MQNNPEERAYLNLAKDILANGQTVMDRTGVGTRSVFGRQLRFDLTTGFPLLTTKRIFTKAIVYELLWFLSGSTNVKFLQDNGVGIWDEWADENGELGPVYGKQWRSWPPKNYWEDGIDQIENLLNGLRTNPHGRRHIVSAWNPAEVDDMALPPCHCLFQFYVRDIPLNERVAIWKSMVGKDNIVFKSIPESAQTLNEAMAIVNENVAALDAAHVPQYYLDCQLYQRSH